MPNFQNSYINLPEDFYQKISPTKVSKPELIEFNEELAHDLNIKDIDHSRLAEFFSGNTLLPGSEPIAQAYSGHQFGQFNPSLGDGRAILLGEILDKQGLRKDIQLKGAGPTQYSRSGDGRAWLGPVIREYIVSEAMHKLGVPTTRSLAAVKTGEDIYRETALPGAILTRVASSHIRIGTFEYFAARENFEALKTLQNYVIERHYPEIKSSQNPSLEFIRAVAQRQATLVAKWMSIGFVHGVMNTDNASIAGETIDYGPCAFMNFYHPQTVFSSIDHYARYAYMQQASICQWNISCLANTLLGFIDDDRQKAIDSCTEILNDFKLAFENEFRKLMFSKIGIKDYTNKDNALLEELLSLMQKYRADFTLSFRYLSELLDTNSNCDKFLELFDQANESKSKIQAWLDQWRSRLQSEKTNSQGIKKEMDLVNPLFIPRNHRIEAAIELAHHHDDFSEMKKLLKIFSNPYTHQEDYLEYSLPPSDKDFRYQTFCGT